MTTTTPHPAEIVTACLTAYFGGDPSARRP